MVRGEEVPDMKCDRSGKLDFLKTFGSITFPVGCR